MSDYSVEFNVEEVEKLKRIAALLQASAGQNEEYNSLAQWLSEICNEEENGDESAPKKGKFKKKKKDK